MIYWPTLLWPDPRLHQPAEPINTADFDQVNLITTLCWFARVTGALKYGIREATFRHQQFLAAPIFGLNRNLMIELLDEKSTDESTLRFLSNTEIVDASSRAFVTERCPCFGPVVTAQQSRPTRLTVEWTILSIDYKEQTIVQKREEATYVGAKAQALHHELEHLAGRTMVDTLSSLKKSDLRQRSAWFRDKSNSPLFDRWNTFEELAQGVKELDKDRVAYIELRNYMKEMHPKIDNEPPDLRMGELIKEVHALGKFDRSVMAAFLGFSLDGRDHKIAHEYLRSIWPDEDA